MSAGKHTKREQCAVHSQTDVQFKFINGNDWSGNGDGNVDNELVIGECAAEGSDNRLLSVGTEDLVYAVCYNLCDAECVENPDPADVIFRVDMSEHEVNAGGVWVIGNFTEPNWQMGALQMTGWCQASLPDKQPVANNQWVGEKAEERTTCNFNGNKDGL